MLLNSFIYLSVSDSAPVPISLTIYLLSPLPFNIKLFFSWNFLWKKMHKRNIALLLCTAKKKAEKKKSSVFSAVMNNHL